MGDLVGTGHRAVRVGGAAFAVGVAAWRRDLDPADRRVVEAEAGAVIADHVGEDGTDRPAMAGHQHPFAQRIAAQVVPSGHHPVAEHLGGVPPDLVVHLLADLVPVRAALGGQQFGGQVGVGAAVDLVEAVDDPGGQAESLGRPGRCLDGSGLGAGDHRVDLLARQPRGEAFGLPPTDLVQIGVGNGGGVDDDLGASVSDEDDVHGGRRYRTCGAVQVLGAVSTPIRTSTRCRS